MGLDFILHLTVKILKSRNLSATSENEYHPAPSEVLAMSTLDNLPLQVDVKNKRNTK